MTEQIFNIEQLVEHPEWNESYYFVFFSKEDNLGGMSRIGFKPNKEEGMTFFFLFLPDGSVAGYHQEVRIKEYTKGIHIKGMSHNYNSDGTWNYQFKGNMIFVQDPLDLPKVRDHPKLIMKAQQVIMDLKFNSINKPYEYSEFMSPESLEIGKKSGDKHWEQIGKISGKIKLGEQNFNFKNVIGQRDHTYGVRDWTGVGNWFYYVVWFNENLAINPAAIITDDGRLSTGGFIFKNGENIPLKAIKIIDKKFQNDGILPISSEIELIDDYGEKHNLKARVGPIIPVPFNDEQGNKSILVQSFGTFELDSISEGYGSFETLRRIKTKIKNIKLN